MTASDVQDETAAALFKAIGERLAILDDVKGSKAEYLLKLARAHALVAGTLNSLGTT